jgi:uncharacterized protein YjbI with pentapeptide repeats
MAMTNMALKPLTRDDPLYPLLRDGSIKEFKPHKTQRKKSDLTSCDLRHLDLRGLDAADIDFSGCPFAPPICPASISLKPGSKAQQWSADLRRSFSGSR